jgi:hypothetical protein
MLRLNFGGERSRCLSPPFGATGAKVAYAVKRLAQQFPVTGQIDDFHPSIGPFKSPVSPRPPAPFCLWSLTPYRFVILCHRCMTSQQSSRVLQ